MGDLDFQNRIAFALNQIKLPNPALAKDLGASIETIRKYKKGSGDLKGVVIEGLAKKFGYNPDWLLMGKGPMFIPGTDIDKIDGLNRQIERQDQEAFDLMQESGMRYDLGSDDLIESECLELVKRFSDKQEAREVCKALLQLENASPAAFKKVGAYLRGVVDGLRMNAGHANRGRPERRISQRRKGDDSEKIPKSGDRRSGKDRRRSVGEN